MTNMATRHNVLERCEDIIKPENDDRLYRGLVLNNKMKVLLISDPKTDTSSAALTINLGYMCDPDDLPGLAHLCEHTLLLGNEKYSVRNNCKKYMSENAGHVNATTNFDYTIYDFDVNPTKLAGALERFAEIFLTLHFTDTLIKRELNAIHSEYLKNLAFDSWRISRLIQLSANPRHPYSKFGVGNRESLDELPKQMGINVRQRLLEFQEKYYSANVMSLCVLGAETLDELEEIIVRLFSQIRNKKIVIPTCSEPPFDDEHLCTKWYMVSIEGTRNLYVTFPTPNFQEHYQSKPLYYVSHMMEQEGKGSLFSILDRRNWCTFITISEPEQTPGCDMFMLEMGLTEEGIKHVDDIVTVMFQYINMLKQQGPVEWIYNEYRDLEEMKFRFTEKEDPGSYVFSRAVELRKYPMKEILCGDCLFTQWKPELIDAIMKCLTPKNIKIYVTAKEFEDVANETEYWYGTKYKREKISTEVIDMWENAGYNLEFYLPDKNEFIPSRLSLKPHDDKVEEFPTIIADTPFVKMWFKQDDEYFVPKAKMFIHFISPLMQIDGIGSHYTSMCIFLLKIEFTQYVHSAGLAGLHWSFEKTVEGITISIYGYDQKQHIILRRILNRMLNTKLDSKYLTPFIEWYVSNVMTSFNKTPETVDDCIKDLLCEPYLSSRLVISAVIRISVTSFQAFLKHLFDEIYVECLIYGNILKKEALDIARMIESKLKRAVPDIEPYKPQKLLWGREVKLDDGCHFLLQHENKRRLSSDTIVYYQIGKQSTESNMLLDLLVQIMNEPCYDILRTQEQLGYIVNTVVHKLKLTQGLLVIVESEKHPRYVEKRIDSFIHSMLDYISNMSKEKFEKHKDSLITLRVKESRRLFLKIDMFWKEITQQIYNTDRVKIEIDYLETITQEQLLNFFKEKILSPARRKLSLHMISMTRDNDESEKEQVEFDDMLATGQIVKIKDSSSFKNSQCLYPAV